MDEDERNRLAEQARAEGEEVARTMDDRAETEWSMHVRHTCAVSDNVESAAAYNQARAEFWRALASGIQALVAAAIVLGFAWGIWSIVAWLISR